MALTVRDSVKQMYCAPINVRRRAPLLVTGLMSDQEIETYIQQADSEVLLRLITIYGSSTGLLALAPYATPVTRYSESDLDGNELGQATGGLICRGVLVAATAITEQWKIAVTDASPDTFVVTGSMSGAQGSGNTGADFTSTNSDIQIPIASWSGDHSGVNTDDFYFSTHKEDPIIAHLSAMLAAGLALVAKTSEETPNFSDVGSGLISTACEMLQKLADPASDLKLRTFGPRDIDPIPVYYSVDEYGDDVTKYSDAAGSEVRVDLGWEGA